MMQDDASAASAETTVRVELGDRSYDIVIGAGLNQDAGKRIASVVPGARCAVVSDANVAALHLAPLKASLAAQRLFLGEVVVAPGEASKSFPMLADLCARLLELGVERGDCVVAFGGGVVGDLAGFAASILRRGVRLVQMPTSLLAQVDSSVGGKTGIDVPQGKNLIGAFHQPCLVLADTALLATLPPREFRAGYAEVAKYGLIGDASFFAWLETNWPEIFASQGEARTRAIATSCRAKAAVVEADEREVSGARALLNLGHTFGHALEAYAGYSERLLHGEAIAIGMRMAFAFSAELGICARASADRVAAHLAAVGLPTAIAAIPGKAPTPAALLKLMGQDKKVKGGRLAFVLARGIGQAFLDPDVPMDKLEAFLARECASPSR
jgi:3-dehydroquinate synthase